MQYSGRRPAEFPAGREGSMMHPVNRRRSGLVNREFQVGLALRFLIAFVLLFLIGMAIVFTPALVGVATGKSLSELEVAASELLILHRRVWPAAIFVGVGMFLYSLWVSRRIAGPAYRINAVLRLLLDGNPPEKVRLRKGDYLQETAELLEELVLRERGGRKGPEGGSPPRGGSSLEGSGTGTAEWSGE
jgi:hypothetical protein